MIQNGWIEDEVLALSNHERAQLQVEHAKRLRATQHPTVAFILDTETG